MDCSSNSPLSKTRYNINKRKYPKSKFKKNKWKIIYIDEVDEKKNGNRLWKTWRIPHVLIYSRLKSHSVEISGYTRRNVHSRYDFSLKCLSQLRYDRDIECSGSHECDKERCIVVVVNWRKIARDYIPYNIVAWYITSAVFPRVR